MSEEVRLLGEVGARAGVGRGGDQTRWLLGKGGA